MPLPLVSEITVAARVLMGDVSQTSTVGEAYPDVILIPFVARAYRYAARYLRAQGVGLFRKESAAILLAVGKTQFNRISPTPLYPSDMLRPIQLREAPASGGTYQIMKLSDGFLPDQPISGTLKIWDWREDELRFPGASVDTNVQIQYESELSVVTAGTDTCLIPDSLDALAALTAAYAALSRDEKDNALALQTMAEKDLDLIAVSEKIARKAAGAAWGNN